MAFKEIQKGIQRRLSTIKKSTSFSQQVVQVITTLYPRARYSISRVVHESKRRRVRIYTANRSAANRFAADRALIHAALRREGIDVREVVIR
jgi:hypothetical protein